MFPDDYKRADQKVICHFVDNAANLKFAPAVPEEKLAALHPAPEETLTSAATATTETTASN